MGNVPAWTIPPDSRETEDFLEKSFFTFFTPSISGTGSSITRNPEQGNDKSSGACLLVVVMTVTSCPERLQYLAQEYGRRDAMEFFGGKNAVKINIFMSDNCVLSI
jgi:hypothetical protein